MVIFCINLRIFLCFFIFLFSSFAAGQEAGDLTDKLKPMNDSSIEKKDKMRIERFVAQAYTSSEKKKLLYLEDHEASFYGEKVLRSKSIYFLPDRSRKIAELSSDYTNSLIMPVYTSIDYVHDSQEGVRFKDGKYVLFSKKSGKAEKLRVLNDVARVFSGQGWHYYLRDNLEKLTKDPLRFRLAVPSRLEVYSVRIKSLPSSEERLDLKLEFGNWVMRMVAPSFELSYDRKSRRLLAFKGPSNILTEEGKTQDVYLEYKDL